MNQKKKKVKISKFEIRSILVFLMTLVIYFIGTVYIDSKDTELNIKSQQIENEIKLSQDNINALNLSIEKKTDLSYLKMVAESRGYYYCNNSEVTAYVQVEKDSQN